MSALASGTVASANGDRRPGFGSRFIGLSPVCVPVPKKNGVPTSSTGSSTDKYEKVENIEKVKRWVIESAKDSTSFLTDKLIVLEVQCFEPGCVPVETVIMLSTKQHEAAEPTRSQLKIFKPVKEVTEANVVDAVMEFEGKVRAVANESPRAKDTSPVVHAVNCPCCDPYSDYVAGMYGDF